MGAVERRKKRRSLAKRTRSIKGKFLALKNLGVQAAFYIADPESGEQWTHNLEHIPLIHSGASEQGVPSPESVGNSIVEPAEGIATEHTDYVEKCGPYELSLTESDRTENIVECTPLIPSTAPSPPDWEVLVRCFAYRDHKAELSAQTRFE